MKLRRLAAAVLVALPLSGCVFAVGSGDNEPLRDRVRKLEKRVEKLESPGQVQIFSISGDAK